jgi:hypothetical protein
MEDQSIWSSLIDQHMDSIETLRSVDRWMYKEVKGAFSSLFSAAEFVSPKIITNQGKIGPFFAMYSMYSPFSELHPIFICQS